MTATPYEQPVTRVDADRMALEFLRDQGPHTMGRIDDEGALAAMMVFLGLEKLGHVRRTDFGGGHLQFAITPAGRAILEGGR